MTEHNDKPSYLCILVYNESLYLSETYENTKSIKVDNSIIELLKSK